MRQAPFHRLPAPSHRHRDPCRHRAEAVRQASSHHAPLHEPSSLRDVQDVTVDVPRRSLRYASGRGTRCVPPASSADFRRSSVLLAWLLARSVRRVGQRVPQLVLLQNRPRGRSRLASGIESWLTFSIFLAKDDSRNDARRLLRCEWRPHRGFLPLNYSPETPNLYAACSPKGK